MSPESASGLPGFILLTCEHGGRDVPDSYKSLFRGQKEVLDSHRGYDIGALGVALRMASRLAVPIIFSTVTRLLVDLNRSDNAADVFSEFTRGLAADERERILATHYRPHRERVEQLVTAAIASGHRVLHLGVHSCTDELNGNVRDLDISLLFDEARGLEAELCDRFRAALQREAGGLRYPFNEPYRGADDGLTTTLRSRFAPEEYLGIEIEVRQGMVRRAAEQKAVGDLLAVSLRTGLGG